MSTYPEPPQKEHPSTYFVQNRDNQDELTRVTVQDHMITASMGGVLPEQPDPAIFRRVLDVGCGTGGWAIEAARQYPEMLLIGIDVSKRMIDYAREQAEAARVSDRVEFHAMDALRILEFPDEFFDLVNMRCGGSFMRTWDWPKLLDEMLRITRSGGIIRDTEPEILHYDTSPALMQFWEMFQCAMFRSGHLFAEDTTGIIAHLPGLLTRHGCEQVQTRDHALEHHAGTEGGEAYYTTMMHGIRTLRPFLDKWGCVNCDYDAMYQQALTEMRQDTFHSTWNLRTAWGIRP
ncbi:MAG: methyltransferase domain-containing protein [Ktedonobacteraceae bacterium]|nr:methyltransferase domain-containing protein [Ktedonobacteraceae bacterium]